MNLHLIENQIKCDIHNIQEMINMLSKAKTKSEWIVIRDTIRRTVKSIRHQKELISDKIYHQEEKTQIPLFEVEFSETKQDIKSLDSFFGKLE